MSSNTQSSCAIRDALLIYGVSTAIIFIGVFCGTHCLSQATHGLAKKTSCLERLANWDGEWYVRIVVLGYEYDSAQESSVAFYPAYPLLAYLVRAGVNCSPTLALLIVSHAAFLLALWLLIHYCADRLERRHAGSIAGLWLALYPTSFYYRMAYSESLFLLVMLSVMFGIQRRWPPALLAVLAGLATGCRAAGVALVFPLIVHWWESKTSIRQFAVNAVILTPVAVWGLLAFATYQLVMFDEPLAFVNTQSHWHQRPNPSNVFTWIAVLGSGEPIWSVYDPHCVCFWGHRASNVLESMQFLNPIYFCVCGLFIATGALSRQISHAECALSVGLLAVPYLGHAYTNCMASEGRYASIVFPMYILLGLWTTSFSNAVRLFFAVGCGSMLFWNTAMFSAWYRYY